MDVYQRRRCAIAYTKIIPVRHHLQRCLDYTSNPNKTEIFTESDLKRLLSYTQNQDKTEHQLYVSGFQCDPDTACQSMEETKRVWFMPTDKGMGNNIIPFENTQPTTGKVYKLISTKPGEVE